MGLPPFLRALHLAVWCAGLAACNQQAAAPPPPELELSAAGDLDPEVVEFVESQVERARRSPGNAELRRDLALALEANGMYSEAEAAWDVAISMRPDDAVWQYHRAACVAKTGESDRATEMMREVVEASPALTAAQYHLGRLYLQAGRFDEAKPCFRVAERLTQRHPGPLAALAELAFQQDDLDAAEAYAREAVAVANDYREGHFVLGKILRAKGDARAAERELRLGAEPDVAYLPTALTPELTSMRRGYGARSEQASRYLGQSRPDLAADLLEDLYARHPEDTAVAVNLGVAYTHLGQPAKAKEILLATIERFPDSATAYLNLAACEIDLDEKLEAMTHINKAIDLAPDLGRSYVVKAQIYTEMGRHQDAYDTLLAAQQLNTTDAQVQMKLGSAAAKLKDEAKALEHFQECVALDPENIRAHLNIAMLQLKFGRQAEANEAYQAAKAVNPEDPFVKDFERWIDKLNRGEITR